MVHFWKMSHHKQNSLSPDRVSIAIKCLLGFSAAGFSVCQINICSSLEGSKSSDSLFKLLDEMTAVEILMTVEYCCAVVANRVFSALSPPFIAFSSSAKCSEPRPHPVHTQTGGAGERLRHASVSRWVCCFCHAPTWKNSGPIHFWGWDAFQVVVSCLSSDFVVFYECGA